MRTMFGLAAGDGSLEGHHTATACNVSRGCENESRPSRISFSVLMQRKRKTGCCTVFRFHSYIRKTIIVCWWSFFIWQIEKRM